MKFYTTCKTCVAEGKDPADVTFEHDAEAIGDYSDHMQKSHPAGRLDGIPGVTDIPSVFKSPRRSPRSPRKKK